MTFADAHRDVRCGGALAPRRRACSRATASRSPRATSPSGSSRSGPRRRSVPSSCRSNAWWTGPELAYGLADSGSVVAVRRRRTRRAHRTAPRRDTGAGHGAHPFRRDLPAACRGRTSSRATTRRFPTSSIDPDADAAIMYTSGTTGTPEGRGADAAQLRQLPHAGRVLHDARGRERCAPPSARRRHRSWRRCSRSRCSTSAGCSRSCCRSRRRAARSSSCTGGTPDEAVDIIEREGITTDRRRADDDVRAARSGEGEGCDDRVAGRHLVRRDARTARARAPHRRADIVPRRARQRLRPHGDLRCGDRATSARRTSRIRRASASRSRRSSTCGSSPEGGERCRGSTRSARSG